MNPALFPLWRRYAALGAKLAAFVALVWLASYADDWLLHTLDFHLSPASEPNLHRLVMAATLLYVVLMAVPFCPGIEIGLGLIAVLGAEIVPLVYGATVTALLLAFAVGRFVPAPLAIRAFDRLGMHRTRDMLARMDGLDPKERLALLQGSSPRRWVRTLLRYRYAAVAIALNTPGNIVLGDGGGIALAAGFSRLFSLQGFALTVIIAVSPLPLIILLSGR